MDMIATKAAPDSPPNSSSPSTSTAQPSATATGTKSAMLVHLTTDGVPKLHCPICDKALVSLSGYVKHVKKHEPPGGFICRYCDGRFCSDDELKKHRAEVHTTIICRLCTEVTFTNENDYREHIRILHDGIDREMFKCDKCGAVYKTLYPFKRHMETECGTIKPYKCEQCSMSFVTKYNLKQHKVLHTGERKYCCSYCGKNFLQKGRLVEHERSHTGEKPHKCDVCGKCFAHRESIVTHSSIHTGIRLVECKCCLTRFSCHSNLIKHRRTRPDTCGLPEFDPPKQRLRTHCLRIPPTLNPTSEIKVSNSNRVIKPDHKAQLRKRPKKELKKVQRTKSTARKSTATGPGAITEERVTNLIDGLGGVTKLEKESSKYASDSDEDYPGFDPADSDSEYEYKADVKSSLTKEASIKEENGIQIVNEIDDEHSFEDDELEFIDSRRFVDGELGIKSENDDKVKLLDCLLNDDVVKNGSTRRITKTEPASLQETELVFVKNENDVNYAEEEDILNIDHPDNSMIPPCKITLIDVCQRYPALKGDSSVIVARNAASFPRPKKRSSAKGRNMRLDVDDRVKVPKAKIRQSIENNKPTNSETDENAEHAFTGGVGEEKGEMPFFGDDGQENLQNGEIGEENLENVYFSDEGDAKEEIMSLGVDDAYVGNSSVNDEEDMLQEINSQLSLHEHKEQDIKKQKRGRKRRKLSKNTTVSNSADENGETQGKIRKSGRMAKLSQKELKARLKQTKRAEKPWQCPYCIKVYHIRKPFENHLRVDHKRPEEELKEMFKSEEAVIDDGEVFKCHICHKIYLMEKRLTNHIEMHGPDGSLTFKCPCYCSLYFATKEDATAHARKEHRDLIYCNICEKYMTGHDSLKNHMRKHEQEKDSKSLSKRNFVCDKCGKKFSGRTSLTDHVRSDCGRKPLYECNICGKNLTTAGILKTHLLLHKDDTPYQCDKCGKTFKVKAQYKTHLKTRHTDYKPFTCHLCPRAYPYRESLLTHMTVHTGIKRFLCNGCGKRFTCVSNLQAHRKVHSETCGQLPLNAKATQYMGVQKGNLLLGAKPEAGVDYKETNTLLAKEVIDRDRPITQEINYPSEPSAPLATVPLNYTQSTTHLLLPQVVSHYT
ncbi:uncharacterized protein LOC118735754 [Rhagoletis pomonella]|uniref:uncharacterized protein LOC118735754 n=1 Tax=Rhagoletis pomonella TaxID=28610 RepID=UPI0017868EA7|nr:uncharacterized protein LOC118735754 [Rhagoletis pomonella]